MGKATDLLNNLGDFKGTFQARMGTIKGRKGKDLLEAEEIKKRWQEYREELHKKVLMTRITMMVWSVTRHSGVWSQVGLRKHYYEQS